MPRVLPVVIAAVLLVSCFIDAIQSPSASVRNLPKWTWLLVIVFLPIIGPLAWLFAGRPRQAGPRPGPTAPSPRPRTRRAPDDDPEFLASLKHGDPEHERLLKKWEADLKRREDELREREKSDPEPS